MQFKDVIGQNIIKQSLLSVISNDRLSHAYLLTGELGVGKLSLAIAFAQYISCTNKQEGDSCGTCPSCLKYKKLAHPDLHFVFPVIKGKSNSVVSDDYIKQWREKVSETSYFDLNEWYDYLGAENKQGMIYQSESENIIHKLSLKSYESEYKIMIIWQADLMNTTCANKLLKMIEEPPSKTIFLLISDKPEGMISTILSRTQNLRVPRIEEEDIENALKLKMRIDMHMANSYSRLANGSWLKALRLVETTEENEYNLDKFISIMRLCWMRNVLDIMSWSKDVSQIGREKQKSFLLYSVKMVRENFIKNIDKEGIVYMSNRELDVLKKFSPYINELNVIKIYYEFNRAYSDIVRNGNPKMVFLDLGLKLVKLIRP